MTNAVLIVAAGRGSRLGAPLPKQYLPIGDVPVLRRTVQAFVDHAAVDIIQVVIAEADRHLYEMALAGIDLPPPAIGGATRQQSVLNGLEALSTAGPARVLIHDAARPFVSAEQIDTVLGALETNGGALPILPLVDSIKRLDGVEIVDEVDRAVLGRAQTPQGFNFQQILEAHRAQAGRELTDDAAVARLAGLTVVSIPGDEANFKITTSEDLARAETALKPVAARSAEEVRSGLGFDVHRFATGRPMILCGVEIAHSAGLDGHSDADVGLHAITDAVLGAVAEGDIGDHFPPTEPKWRGAPSDLFLRHAGKLVAEKGGRITAIDVTLICEAPKIKPHRAAMCARIAEILALEVDRVSVKATTTERLGFAGRSEGIAAQAIATVALPGRDSSGS